MVVLVAHSLEAGENVYVVVVVLFIVGDHVPEIPFVEVVGSVKVSPSQIGEIALKVGVLIGFTVMVKVCVVAHCPELGVNV
jgi:hypothetical protein